MLVWKDGKLQKKHEDLQNPEAKSLADRYVSEIRKLCGWRAPTSKLQGITTDGYFEDGDPGGLLPPEEPQNNQENTKELPRNFQETEKEWELGPDDIEALEKIPF